MAWDGVLIFIAVITVVVIWLRWNYNHWKNRGIPYLEPSIVFGNFKELIIGNINFGTLNRRFYEMFPGEPVFGVFMMRSPILIARDLDLIRSILVTNFANFRENFLEVSREVDPVLGRTPFFLKGEEWKERRRKYSRHHTASKLKTLFGYIEEVKDELVDYINQNLGKKFDVMDFSKRYTTDVTGSCVFGVKTRSHAGEDSDFSEHSIKLFDPSVTWKWWLFEAAHSLFKLFKIPLLHKSSTEFFKGIVEKVVDTRRKNNVSRADFLQHLISDPIEEFTVTEMAVQAISFFVDGFLTSATEMSFFLYMVAIHPDVQERLREEVNSAKVLDFETIHSLPYLNAVFTETLRFFPAGDEFRKVCNDDITITVKNRQFEFKSGDQVCIPVLGVHFDPEHFPEPQRFNPDRFLDQPNHPAFLGFSLGPRACIGERFAKTQIKSGVANLVKNFRISPGEEDHSIPNIENNDYVQIIPDGDMTITFSKL